MKIAISGRSGSGKSEVAAHLARTYGYYHAHPGSYCRQVCNLLFGKDDKTTLNMVNDALRELDPNVWVNAALRNASEERSKIVIDGVRFKSNYDLLRPLGYEFWLIVSDAGANLERMNLRKQEFDPSVDAAHAGENEFQKIQFNHVIENDGDIDDLKKKVDALLWGR